jgi:hypothetical protein
VKKSLYQISNTTGFSSYSQKLTCKAQQKEKKKTFLFLLLSHFLFEKGAKDWFEPVPTSLVAVEPIMAKRFDAHILTWLPTPKIGHHWHDA